MTDIAPEVNEERALAELSSFFEHVGNELERDQLQYAALADHAARTAYQVRQGIVTKRGEAKCALCQATIPDGARVWSQSEQRGRGSGGCHWLCRVCRPLSREELGMSCAALIRVSTDKEQTTDPQRLQIETWATSQSLGVVTWYEENGVSGASKRRPVRDALVAACREGKHDTLVVAALDRLGRNAAEVVQIIAEFQRLGVRVVSLRESLDLGTTIGQMVASVLAFVAQIELENIRARTRAGLANARAKGVQLGRRKGWIVDDIESIRARIANGESPESIAPTLVGRKLVKGADGTFEERPWKVSASALRARL